jgi:DNA-binding MltR family transcriptional regulator
MENDAPPSPDLSNFSEFHREGIAFGEQLEQESDRGAALVGLAFLDELLKRLFEAKMMLAGKITKKLLEYPGALSTAAARTDIAYSLGWIGAKTHRDLVSLRKIRNEFAHAHEPVKFTDTAIEALCAKLELGKATFTGPLVKPREQFSWAAGSLVMRLEFYRRAAKVSLTPFDGPPEELDSA